MIIDCDRHVIEPIAIWGAYLDPEFRDGAPVLAFPHADEPAHARLARLGPAGLAPLPPVPMIDGELLQRGFSERAQAEIARVTFARAAQLEASTRPDGQLAGMDAAGVDAALLLPTYALFLLAVDTMEPRRADAFARAYNRWLADYTHAAPARLLPAGALALHDPDLALAELERVAALGWRAITLRPNPVRGRTLGDPAYDRLWSACAHHELAVALHEGTHARVPTIGADRFRTRFAQHAASHPMEQQLALLALLEGGVLERHPTLRVAFLEAGATWLPYWLWRLDEEFHHLAAEVQPHIQHPPSTYLRRQCFATLEPTEPSLPATFASFPSSLLFGSDFPHLDHEPDLVARLLSADGPLPPDATARVTDTNARRFLRL